MKLVELKMKKAELRNRMDVERQEGNLCIEPETFIEYQDVIRALKWAESRLLKPIVIALVLLSILISGCGKMWEGTGRIMEGLGDGIVYAGEHIQESTSTK